MQSLNKSSLFLCLLLYRPIIETIKNASLHIQAVWLAIAYIAVILAMTIDFIARLRKAKLAGKVTLPKAVLIPSMTSLRRW